MVPFRRPAGLATGNLTVYYKLFEDSDLNAYTLSKNPLHDAPLS